MAIVHEIVLDRYSPIPARLTLGTNDSYGVEQLHLIPGAGWEDLSMVATWHPPGGADPVQILASLDGTVDVPAEATALAGDGLCVIAGLADGVRLLSCSIAYRVMPQAGYEGKEAAEPTPDLVQQVVTAANKATEIAESVRADADKMTEAETARTEAESARESAESARKAAESARDQAEQQRESAEEARGNAENKRAASEQSRVEAENARQDAEAARAQAESERKANESTRQQTESERQAAEQIRTSEESTRKAAESTRQQEESTRQGNESTRERAESSRETAEQNRVSAESSRTNAESARATAEQARKTGEDTRVAAEQNRESAEADRVKAETARVDAENQREQDFAAMKEQVDSKAEIDDTAVTDTAAWSSKQIIDTLCPPLEETGNPVVCYPVANYPLGVTVSWEPTQEGSGDPYPPGGGSNILNPEVFPASATRYGITWTMSDDGTVTVDGTAQNANSYFDSRKRFTLPAGTYTLCAMAKIRMSILKADDRTTIAANVIGNKKTFTLAEDTECSAFLACSGTHSNTKETPAIVKGSADIGFSPYSNIRPISGRDEIRVGQCGGNLLPIFSAESKDKGITWRYENGTLSAKGTSTGTSILLLPNEKKKEINRIISTVKGNKIGLQDCPEITLAIYDKSWNGITIKNDFLSEVPTNIGETINVYFQIAKGKEVNYSGKPMMVLEMQTDYSPYRYQTVSIALQNVCGGSVDVATCDGMAEWALVTLTVAENWITPSSNAYYAAFGYSPADNSTNGMASHYPYGTGAKNLYANKNGAIVLYGMNDSLSVDEWKSFLAAQYAAGTPVQIAYKLAEPIPFTATGGQPIPALSGVNTILTDADTLTVTGRADPIKRITDLETSIASMTTAE